MVMEKKSQIVRRSEHINVTTWTVTEREKESEEVEEII